MSGDCDKNFILEDLNNCVVVTYRQQPLVSIITVVLNGAKTLEKAIKSVVNLTFKDYEYIIIDGKSMDGSLRIIKKYESKISYWISEQDTGVYDAMNKAVSLASGRWVYFLGADDELLDGFETAVNHLRDKQTLYYGDVNRLWDNRRYDGKFTAYKLASRNICHQSIFYPSRVFEKYRFNLQYSILADYELNLRCWQDSELEFCYLPLTIAKFNDKNGLSPNQVDPAFYADRRQLIKQYFPYPVFLMASLRFMIIEILTFGRLDKLTMNCYHYWLRILRKIQKLSIVV